MFTRVIYNISKVECLVDICNDSDLCESKDCILALYSKCMIARQVDSGNASNSPALK